MAVYGLNELTYRHSIPTVLTGTQLVRIERAVFSVTSKPRSSNGNYEDLPVGCELGRH